LDVIRYARQRNLKINKDICFVSYANLPITKYVDYPPLASVEQFPYEQGVKATELLFKLIDQKSVQKDLPAETIVLKSDLIIH
jgi:DNA-binding LacI/PurR family transcriptional regulator